MTPVATVAEEKSGFPGCGEIVDVRMSIVGSNESGENTVSLRVLCCRSDLITAVLLGLNCFAPALEECGWQKSRGSARNDSRAGNPTLGGGS